MKWFIGILCVIAVLFLLHFIGKESLNLMDRLAKERRSQVQQQLGCQEVVIGMKNRYLFLARCANSNELHQCHVTTGHLGREQWFCEKRIQSYRE